MKKEKIILLTIITIMVVIVIYSFTGEDEETREEYISRIIESRAEKNTFFKYHEDSPFKDSTEFKGLNYFPPDPDFIVTATVIPAENSEYVTLVTSDDKIKKYEKFGYAEFDLLGKKNRVLLFKMEEPYENKLFLPFADETSTEETYGAGRYLELEKPDGNTLEIDFNQAYNPYCAYVEEFSCPFPPVENILEIPIKAGEKNYD